VRLQDLIKHSANRLGVDIVRLRNKPLNTVLGLRYLPIRTILDVGANSGQFARYISRMLPAARLYCFEPLSEPFRQLEEWAGSGRHANVKVFNLALGDTQGTVEMFQHVDHTPSSSILRATSLNETLFPGMVNKARQQVEVTTLDHIMERLAGEVQPDILVKLDVQGYEDRVIRGAANTLHRARACLLEVNVDPLYQGQASFRELFMLLDSRGFHYAGNFDQYYADDGRVLFLDALFLK
jgi:FkbM family methyltransferase